MMQRSDPALAVVYLTRAQRWRDLAARAPTEAARAAYTELATAYERLAALGDIDAVEAEAAGPGRLNR
jgi:hypothetical protein